MKKKLEILQADQDVQFGFSVYAILESISDFANPYGASGGGQQIHRGS